MAQRHAQITAQIQNVRQLEAVVTAMRGIAAARAQHGRALLPGIDAYSDVISAAIGQALALLPQDASPSTPAPTRRGVVAFAAEQGFAGTFAERLLETVVPDFEDGAVFLVGGRGLTLARERGLEPAWSATLPTHIEALPSLANHLAEALYVGIARGELAAVDLVFARSASGPDLEIDRHSLLPLSYDLFARATSHPPPLVMLAPERLLQRLSEEYVFAQLYKAAMHAFEAENEARMRAMAAAKTNIETKLSDLTRQERQLRQDEITDEIIELAAGAEAALRSDRG